MEPKRPSYIEQLGSYIAGLFKANELPFLSALIAGLAAHMFMISNKLVNHDEIEALFSKGATVTSGRWGLELSHYIFPNVSMPWIYGLISIILFAVAACLLLRVLDLRSGLSKVLIPAIVLSFPSLTGTFCFMFTSAPYALAFLLAVSSAWFFKRGGWQNFLLAAGSLVLCLSIYQAYIALTASLFVLLMLKMSLEGSCSVRQILLWGFKALGMMLLALLAYFAATMLSFALTGMEFNSYVLDNVNDKAGQLGKIRLAYTNFKDIFTYGNYSLVTSPLSHWAHLGLLAVMGLELICLSLRRKEPLRWGLSLVLVLLLPLAINCMYLAMSPASIHTLVLFSFVAIYLMAAMLWEQMGEKALARDLPALLLVLMICSNVYFANRVYLKLHLQYENASAFYTSMIAQIKDTPGFDEDSRLAIIGKQQELLFYPPQLDSSLLLGPSTDLVNIYSRQALFRQYLGFDMPCASEEELEAISQSEEFKAMPIYPYHGSVQAIDSYIVVKMG